MLKFDLVRWCYGSVFRSLQLKHQLPHIYPPLFSNCYPCRCVFDVKEDRIPVQQYNNREKQDRSITCFLAGVGKHIALIQRLFRSFEGGPKTSLSNQNFIWFCQIANAWIRGDKSAFNSMDIFCWSNLGCCYSSLISSRWQEHQIYAGELLNTSFSN